MEDLRGPEASLESSKGFSRGSKSNLNHGTRSCQVFNDPCQKSIKILWNVRKSMKIYKILWKSSEAKKPAWNRAKVSIGAAARLLCNGKHPDAREPTTIYNNAWQSVKTMRIYWNHKNQQESMKSIKCMKPMKIMGYNENPHKPKSQPRIEQGFFYRGNKSYLWAVPGLQHPCLKTVEIQENIRESIN